MFMEVLVFDYLYKVNENVIFKVFVVVEVLEIG